MFRSHCYRDKDGERKITTEVIKVVSREMKVNWTEMKTLELQKKWADLRYGSEVKSTRTANE